VYVWKSRRRQRKRKSFTCALVLDERRKRMNKYCSYSSPTGSTDFSYLRKENLFSSILFFYLQFYNTSSCQTGNYFVIPTCSNNIFIFINMTTLVFFIYHSFLSLTANQRRRRRRRRRRRKKKWTLNIIMSRVCLACLCPRFIFCRHRRSSS
jgi:hypothetical protein